MSSEVNAVSTLSVSVIKVQSNYIGAFIFTIPPLQMRICIGDWDWIRRGIF
jgi:hypothetical protein